MNEERVEAEPPESVPSSNGKRPVAFFGPTLAALGIVTAAVAVAAFRFGEGVIYIDERTISELSVFEVTGGAAFGVFAAVIGLGTAAVMAVGTLVISIIGVAVGALGIGVGAIVALGVVTGPILLVAIVAIIIKRRYWPDVI